MKVRIVSTQFNHPEFIEVQYLSIKKFIKDKNVEYIVINDALDYKDIRNWYNPNIPTEIKNACQKYNIKCDRFPQDLHNNRTSLYPSESYFWKPSKNNNPNTRCSDVCQYGFNKYAKDFDGIYIMLDGDMFFRKDFCFNEYLGEYDMAGFPCPTKNLTYYWNGLLMFNMKTLPNKHLINIDCGVVKDPEAKKNSCVDCGGQLYWYIKMSPNLKLKNIDTGLWRNNPGIMWNYGQGGNWQKKPKSYWKGKNEQLKDFKKKYLNL